MVVQMGEDVDISLNVISLNVISHRKFCCKLCYRVRSEKFGLTRNQMIHFFSAFQRDRALLKHFSA